MTGRARPVWMADGEAPVPAATYTWVARGRDVLPLADRPGRRQRARGVGHSRVVFVDRTKPVIRAVVPKKLTRTTKRDLSFRWTIADGPAGAGVSRDLTIVTYQGRASGSTCVGWKTWRTRKVRPDDRGRLPGHGARLHPDPDHRRGRRRQRDDHDAARLPASLRPAGPGAGYPGRRQGSVAVSRGR